MEKKDYNKTRFFAGIKAKIDGVWHDVVTTDFDTGETTCNTGVGEVVFFVEQIEEFSLLEKK